MRVPFVRAWRESVGLEFAPLVVLSDDESPDDLQELINHGALRVQALETPALSIGVDFWLLAYATETLGNVASTFSANACALRASLRNRECAFHVVVNSNSSHRDRPLDGIISIAPPND